MLKAFDRGMKKAEQAIRLQMINALVKASFKILSAAAEFKSYHYLTGNTYTSYMVGIYEDNNLIRTVTIYEAEDAKKPTSNKLTQGAGTKVIEDYETGRTFKVWLTKFIKTDEGYGEDTSRNFLKSFSPDVNGFALVFTTGTEYSVIREGILQTIDATYDVTPDEFMSSLKQCPLDLKQ